MKQYQIIRAYNELENFATFPDYHVKEQKDIFMLRKKLRPHVEFQQERVETIASKYRPLANANGVLEGQNYTNYLEEMKELDEVEVTETFEKIELPLVDGITFKTMEVLEDFVTFI